MKMEVHVISKESVKPSSPTPSQLRTFELSLLDQLMPLYSHAPIVLFYPMNKSNSYPDVTRRLKLLKTSLSETLTRFYPLAGVIGNEFSIDCNDEGANFVETRVNCCLDAFLTQPDLLFINKLLPCPLILLPESTAKVRVTNIQANVFQCGGIAVGICISHSILDGAALSTFLEGWTTAARVSNKAVYPKFTAPSLFPPNGSWLRDSSKLMWDSFFRKGNCITRRFVFNASAIGKLKAQATCPGMKSPTRVEAVSAFLWKCTIAAYAQLHGFRRRSLLTHLINLRTRMEPSLSENSTGNIFWITKAECPADSKPEYNDLVYKVKDAISRIDSKFVKEMMGSEGNSLISESIKGITEVLNSRDGVDWLGFSSWCKFGHYGADFGWGNPVWVSSIGFSDPYFMNLAVLVDTRSGDGIEAWVTLDRPEMAILESNPELVKLASIDPSPLAINHPISSA